MAGPRRHSRSTIARAAAAARGAGESRAAARAVVDGEDSAACGREKSRGKSRGSVRGLGWKFLSTVSKDLLGKEVRSSILFSPIKGDFGPKSPGIFFWPPEKSRENKRGETAARSSGGRPPAPRERDLSAGVVGVCSARRQEWRVRGGAAALIQDHDRARGAGAGGGGEPGRRARGGGWRRFCCMRAGKIPGKIPGIGSGPWMEVSIDGIERSPRKRGAIVYTFLPNQGGFRPKKPRHFFLAPGKIPGKQKGRNRRSSGGPFYS